jgi:1-acyl-sn-glycerol-3-phosphate acyltransferase/glycine/D-amino acid oxidase-like deaminating enzyme
MSGEVRVCIVGSGIAGLSAAHLLSSRPGASVTVVERDDVYGGRANVTQDGEHCPRFFLDDYTSLFRLFREIPYGSGSVFDLLEPVRRFSPTVKSTWVEIDHLYASMAGGLSVRDKYAIYRNNRRSLLIAKRGETTTNRFGAAANFSTGSLLQLARNLRMSKTAYVLPGCTNTHLVQPWMSYLRSSGVTFQNSYEVERLDSSVDGVRVVSGDRADDFDVVLVTAIAHDAYELIDNSGSARRLDWRQHTHCKCFTVDLDPREEILSDPSPRVYSNSGRTTLVQPAAGRCLTLLTVSESSETGWVLGRLREDLRLQHEPIRVRERDNLAPSEAVFIGEFLDPVKLASYIDPIPPHSGRRARVFFAGSCTRHGYPVDAAEGACRSAQLACERIWANHSSVASVPASASSNGTGSGPGSPREREAGHPNSPLSPRTAAALWRAACRASAITRTPVSRIEFIDSSATTWPLGEPAIYVANHRSIFDVVAGLLTFKRLGVHPHLVVAQKYFKGGAGKALDSIGALPALRGSDATINAAIAAVNGGDSVAFMVEGRIVSRSESEEAQYGRGAFAVAAATSAPVVPIASWGTDQPWPHPRPWPLVRVPRARIAVAIGRPLHIGERSADELIDDVRTALRDLEATAGRHVGAPEAVAGA